MLMINAILPALIISVVGFVLAKFNVINEAGQKSLSKLTFLLLIPSLLFLGIAQADLDSVFYGQYLTAYFIPVLITFATAMVIARVAFGLKEPSQTIFALGSVYANATIIGLPIIIFILGKEAVVPISIIVTVHSFILFTLATFCADRHSFNFRQFGRALSTIFMSFVKNPITMSLLLGLSVNLTGITMPSVIFETIGFMGEAALPISFIVLGASLNAYGLRGQLVPATAISAFKMLMLPFLVWYAMFEVISVNELWAKTAVLLAATPVGIATHVFAQRYNRGEELIAPAIVISTTLSVFAFSFWLSWIS